MTGRKTLPHAEIIGEEVGKHITPEAAAEEIQLRQITSALTADQISFTETVGAFKALRMVERFSAVAMARILLGAKDAETFKGMLYTDEQGNQLVASSFSDCCRAFGITESSGYEMVQNYGTFGEEFMDLANRHGINRTTMRELRRLPPNELDAAKQLLDVDGKEALIEFVETWATKQAKEKESLTKQITNLSADLEATRKVNAKKDQKLNDLEAKLHKRLNDLPEILQEMRADCAEASSQGISAIQKFTQIRLATMDLLEHTNDQETVLGAIGATHLQLLWQLQAWLTEEMRIAEQIFGGSPIEIRALTSERGPDLGEEQVQHLKNAGADEAQRVGARRVVEAFVDHDEKKKDKH